MDTVWMVPTLLSALALGLYDVCKKHAVRGNSVMPALFWATFSGTAVLVLFSLFTGGLWASLICQQYHFWLILFKAFLVSASWICVYYAMRELPISLASPVRSSSPLWTALGGIILYHEVPTLLQGVGMAVILAGYVTFSVLGEKEGVSWKSKGMVLIITGTLFGAGSALYDKYLLSVVRVDRAVLQLYFSLDLVIILGAAWLIRRCFGNHHPFEMRWSVPLTGVLLVAADYIYFYAVSLEGTPISLVSLVRRTSCVVSFALGAKLFRDRNMKRKIFALILLLSGVVLLALGKR